MKTTVAVIQCPLGDGIDANVARVLGHVRDAAARGANVVLPPELFEGPYFCTVEDDREFARAMVLAGAELLLYPTAIGSEPHDPSLDTRDPWQRAMIGHAVSNIIPVCAANRIGLEGAQRFYGSSFCADHRGDMRAELSRDEEGVALATFDIADTRRLRAAWGFFRDRRPDLYGALLTGDGGPRPPR